MNLTGLTELAVCMEKDMRQAMACIPWGFLAGAVYLLGAALYGWWTRAGAGQAPHAGAETKKLRRRVRPALLRAAYFATVVYLVSMLCLTFFSREPGSRTGIDLKLFGTWGKSWQSKAYYIENIILFLPFGILMPCVLPSFRRVRNCVLTGFVISMGIEFAQLVTQRGFCQLDDVVTNTVGTVLGWMIWRIVLAGFCRLGERF